MERIEKMDSYRDSLASDLQSEFTSRSGSFDSQDLYDHENENKQDSAAKILYKKIKNKIDQREQTGKAEKRKSKTTLRKIIERRGTKTQEAHEAEISYKVLKLQKK